jgi:glycosyltransferase involved in cell wall biosynthesis
VKLSVIVSTYNRCDALEAVLQALSVQRGVARDEWEVLVADDGSGPETRAIVERWAGHFPCTLHHVWHEDTGFRLAAIRNRSAARAKGAYLVFLDGDCVPFADFASQTLQLSEPGWFVAGNRVLLSEGFTRELLAGADRIAPIHWSPLQWLSAKWKGRSNRAFPWLRLPLASLRKRRAQQWKVLKGCNIGVWKADFEAVNGFDESFSGWGHEDSDFAVRLIRHGIGLKDGRFAVPVLHLWHRENDRSKQPANRARLQATIEGSHTRAQLGLAQYLG